MHRTLAILLLVAAVVAVEIDDHRNVNEQAHHTDQYRERSNPLAQMTGGLMVLRRGFGFDVDVHGCSVSKMTVHYRVPRAGKPVHRNVIRNWNPHVIDDTHFGFDIPVNAPIGLYTLTACTEKLRFIVVLNPYHKEDPVYVADADNVGEYVENTEGLIWVGSSDDMSGAYWRYDQFDGVNLELAISGLYNPPIEAYGGTNAAANPVFISRHISWYVADKVCTGRWSEPYDKGTDDGEYACATDGGDNTCFVPWKISSVTSLTLSFLKNKRRSVQYCQCFVFAAITNTISRALGLPSRAVTNFNSAADHNDNGAIDKYYEIDNNGNLHELHSGDSTWNFHVWNEAFFKRPPTKSGLKQDGWQAYDGTPQIQSEGEYRVGPASLAAVFAEEKTEKYDVLFLMASTNAPTNIWMKDKKTGKFNLTKTTRNDPFDEDGSIGTKMSSKRPGAISEACKNGVVRVQGGRRVRVRDCTADRDDLTAQYHVPAKRRDFTNARNSMRDLFKRGPLANTAHASVKAKFIFPKVGKLNKVWNGDVITVGFSFKNTGNVTLDINLLYKVKATEYNGNRLGRVARKDQTISLAPGQKRRALLSILPEDYQRYCFKGSRKTEESESLTFALSARVQASPTFWMHEKKLLIHNPNYKPKF